MLKKVKETINKYRMFSKGDRLVVAVSGGADSLALLHVLLRFRGELETELKVVHVNHHLRGEAADQDARMVEARAIEWDVPFSIRDIKVRELEKGMGTSLENAARILRYQVLEEEALLFGADKIVLGHHADDQAETVLLHLLRGAGVDGIAGMLPVRDQKFYRPLLEVSRQEIENYCHSNHIEYCTDLSNLQPVYLRNSVRLELLPLLREKYNTSVEKSLCRLAELAREDSELLWKLADEAYEKVVTIGEKGLLLETEALGDIPTSLQRRVLIRAWQKLSGEVVSPAYERIEALRKLMLRGNTGQIVQLPSGISGEKSYQQLILGKATGYNGKQKQFSYPLTVPGTTKIPELKITIMTELIDKTKEERQEQGACDQNILLLDADLCRRPLVIRNRRDGDIFYPWGAPGKKKLKEFFIDCKIPRSERDCIPLICSDNEVIWVMGKRKSQSCQVTETTGRMLRLTLTTPKQISQGN